MLLHNWWDTNVWTFVLDTLKLCCKINQLSHEKAALKLPTVRPKLKIKVAQIDLPQPFYLNDIFIKITQKVNLNLGYFSKKIRNQSKSKIAQSGHTYYPIILASPNTRADQATGPGFDPQQK